MSNVEHPPYLWHNHRLVRWEDATAHLTDHWWASVGAVFEGIRGYWNGTDGETYIFRLDAHLERLAGSMRLVRMDDSFPPDVVQEAVCDLIRANAHAGDVYVMPLAYSTGGRSFGSVGERVTNMFITSRLTTSSLSEEHSLRAGFSSWRRIDESSMPPRVKAVANYRNSQLAASEAVLAGHDSALMLNAQGKVTEGPGSCVFFVRGGALFTPDLSSGILESITRDSVLRIARELLGLRVEERTVDRTEAYLADEAFYCGTAAEITPIAAIDHHELRGGVPGTVTQQLRDAYHGLVRGTDPRFPEWRTPVGLAGQQLQAAQSANRVPW